MKMTKIMLGGLLAITATANAMPTQEETKKVEPLVMDLMKDDQVALKSGKKTRVEVAESAMSLADKADSEAAKLLLIKGAFNLYVRAGEFDKAIETLQALQAAIPDIPPANMASIIESSLRVVSRKNGERLYRFLDEVKARKRSSNKVVSNDKPESLNSQGCKLPADSMPRTGLMAAYDYDSGEAINSGYGVATINRNDVLYKDGMAFFDGNYKYRAGEDVILPDFNFDHFAVAFSFKTDIGKAMFLIGEDSYPMLAMDIWTGNETRLAIQFKGLSVTPIEYPVELGKWNWVALSVDVRNRQVTAIINGGAKVERLLPEGFYWRMPSDRIMGDAFRRIHFGNANRGLRYTGAIDDLMVYDRALTQAELVDLAKGRPSKGGMKAVASPGAGVKFTAAAELPGKWRLSRLPEISQYWNAQVANGGMLLSARIESAGVVISPIGQLDYESIDLSLPVVDENGKPVPVVAVGNYLGGVYHAHGSGVKVVKLPSTLRELRYGALAGCLHLREVTLPESLELIDRQAFYSCVNLGAIIIPQNVHKIGERAFSGCGSLNKLEIQSKSVRIAKDAFSGNTPVGKDMPKESWTTGPVKKEIKGDPQYAYAKNGRMKEPLFSFGYGIIRMGDSYGDIGGWGSTFLNGHKSLGKMDLSFIKVGAGQLAGVTLKWRKKTDPMKVADEAMIAVGELLALLENKLGGKIKEPVFLAASEWPEYGDGGNHYANYEKLTPIGRSDTEVNGYKVSVLVYGGTKDSNAAVLLQIVDGYMFKAWGLPVPE